MRPEPEVKKKPATLITKTLMVFVLALVASILWQTLNGIRFGYGKTVAALDAQIALFAADVIEREPFLLNAFLTMETNMTASVKHMTLSMPKNTIKKASLHRFMSSSWTKTTQQLSLFFSKGWQVMQLSFLLVMIKFIGIISSLLLFIFSGLLGALDGLNRRYVRTIEAGRESTYLYHNISALFKQVPMFVVLVYIVAPLTIPTTFIIALISVALFVYCNLFFTNLKKFL